jgi:hypothetical protein
MAEQIAALDHLSDVITEAYRNHKIGRARETGLSEWERRQDALEGIDEILELLASASVPHLEFLEALLFLWRELEDEADESEDRGPLAPSRDGPNGPVKALSEYERRQTSLGTIDEILEWRPLIQFSAAHLELLELLFAYWRELEVEGNPRPPEPDGPEGVMSVWQGYLSPRPDVVSRYRRAGPDAD